MDKEKDKKHISKEREGKRMAVSMAVIPMLKGEAAASILETIRTSRIKPYTREEMIETERKVREVLQKRDIN